MKKSLVKDFGGSLIDWTATVQVRGCDERGLVKEEIPMAPAVVLPITHRSWPSASSGQATASQLDSCATESGLRDKRARVTGRMTDEITIGAIPNTDSSVV